MFPVTTVLDPECGAAASVRRRDRHAELLPPARRHHRGRRLRRHPARQHRYVRRDWSPSTAFAHGAVRPEGMAAADFATVFGWVFAASGRLPRGGAGRPCLVEELTCGAGSGPRRPRRRSGSAVPNSVAAELGHSAAGTPIHLTMLLPQAPPCGPALPLPPPLSPPGRVAAKRLRGAGASTTPARLRRLVRLTPAYRSPTSASHWSSVSTLTSRSRALSSLLPAPGPATT